MSSYRVFLSSPSDVRLERDHAQAVIERLNAERADRTPFEIVRWEDSYYTAAADFQSQILEPKECDLVICIFWQRLGTELPPSYRRPDGTTPTGTEFEFENAIEAAGKRPEKVPDVFVYRKSGDLRFSSDMSSPSGGLDIHRLEYEQYQRFMTFWQRWFRSEKGQFLAAFGHFANLEEFETLLENNLKSWLRDRETVLQWTDGSPFRALEPFDVEHAPIFFGRRREIERVRARLITAALAGSPFLLLTGISGAGKSSLVRAGLLPRLKKAGGLSTLGDRLRWAIVSPASLAADWRAGIAKALFASDALGEELRAGDFADPDDLAKQFRHPDGAALPLNSALSRAGKMLAAREQLEKPPKFLLLLVIDQFEELFSWPRSEADGFLVFLKAVCAVPASPFLVLATLRSDFIHRISDYGTLLELSGRNAPPEPGQAERTLELMLPSPADLRDMISGPARAAGLDFEVSDDRDLARIIEENSAPQLMPAVELLLSELYNRRNGNLLELKTFDLLGGVAGVMAKRGDEILDDVSGPARDSFPRVMHALVRQSGNDVPATARRASINAFAGDPVAEELVGELRKARLVLADEHDQWFAHDSILAGWTRLREFVASERSLFDARERLENLCGRWARAAGSEKKRLLLEGFQLDEGRELLNRWGAEALRDKEPEFPAYITASQRRQKSRQILRMVAIVGTAVSVLAALAIYLDLNRSAKLARQISTSLMRAEASRIHLNDGRIYEAVSSAELSYEAFNFLQSRSVFADAILRVSPHLTGRYSLPGNSNQTLVWADENTIAVATGPPPPQNPVASGEKRSPRLLSFSVSAAGATAVREQELPLREAALTANLAVARHLYRLASGRTVAVLADGTVATVGAGPPASTEPSVDVVAGSPSSVSVGQSGRIVAAVTSSDDVLLTECKADSATEDYSVCPKRKLTGLRATAVSINPTETKIAIATRGGDIAIYDRDRREFDEPIKVAAETTALAWANTGDLLAFASTGGLISVIDRSRPGSDPLQNGICTSRISVVSWSSKRPDLGFDCGASKLYIWKLVEGDHPAEREPLDILDAHVEDLSRLAWSPSGNQIAALNGNSVVEIWNMNQTGSGFSTLYAGNPAPVSTLVRTADGKSFASGDANGSLSVWDAAEKTVARRIEFSAKAPVAFLASGGSGEFAASHADGRISIVSAEGNFSFGPVTPSEAAIAFVQNDQMIAVSYPDGHQIKIVSKSDRQATGSLELPDHDASPYGLVADGSGGRLFASYDDGKIVEWNFSGKVSNHPFQDDLPEGVDPHFALGLAVSVSDRWLARSGGDNYFRLYDIAKRKAIKALPTGDDAPNSVSFSPDGGKLAALSSKLFIWDMTAEPPELMVTIDVGSLVPGINLNQIKGQGLVWPTNSELALASGDARISLITLDFDKWQDRAKKVTLQQLRH